MGECAGLGGFAPGVAGVAGLFGVVEASVDDGEVGVAFEEFDDDFLADAGDGHAAVAFAGPGVAGADPAGAGFVGGVVAVPVEFHFHPSVVVHVDFLPGGAGDGGGLRALDDGLGGEAWGAELVLGGDGGEGAGKVFAAAAAVAAFEVVVGGGDGEAGGEVFDVLVFAGVVAEFELSAGGDADGVGAASGDAFLAGDLLDADAGVAFAVAVFVELAGEIEHFVVGAFVFAGVGVGSLEFEAGLEEVVVLEGVGAGLKLALHDPVGDVAFFYAAFIAPFVVDGLGSGAGFVGGEGVHEDELVRAVGVGEVVVDALVLHEAGDEVEGRLAVLDAILPRSVVALELKLHVLAGDAVLFEDGFEDLGDGLVLENAAVRGAAEQPHGGDHGESVAGVAPAPARVDKARGDAAEVARLSIGVLDADGDGCADEFIEVHIRALAEEVHLPGEEPPKLLGVGEGCDGERVAEDGLDGEMPVSLGKSHSVCAKFAGSCSGTAGRVEKLPADNHGRAAHDDGPAMRRHIAHASGRFPADHHGHRALRNHIRRAHTNAHIGDGGSG